MWYSHRLRLFKKDKLLYENGEDHSSPFFLLELYLNSFFCKMVKELSSNGDTNRVVFRVKNNHETSYAYPSYWIHPTWINHS